MVEPQIVGILGVSYMVLGARTNYIDWCISPDGLWLIPPNYVVYPTVGGTIEYLTSGISAFFCNYRDSAKVWFIGIQMDYGIVRMIYTTLTMVEGQEIHFPQPADY
jgi:hypothetical protein